jgi:rhamnosyltransferase
MGHYVRQIHALGGKYFINPDGHEWKRAKWSKPVREYWKQSEKLMIKHADLVICDNLKIEEYIRAEYKAYQPNTTYIAYGTDTKPSTLTVTDETVRNWYSEKAVKENDYYLIVGRFVPENNYETMIREFMASNSTKSLVIITNVAKNKFYESLKVKTEFDKDARIKFVGTVYNQQLLRYIRENAFGYLHGHEVGGTNPSLLEALSSTQLNLLVDVNFNYAVAGDSALYWTKKNGVLAATINMADKMSTEEINALEISAKKTISQKFSWSKIITEYESVLH